MNKSSAADLTGIQQVFIGILIFCIVIGLVVLIIAQINPYPLPPVNSTQESKEHLKYYYECKWYDFACQKLACVAECEEINRNAGGAICVC